MAACGKDDYDPKKCCRVNNDTCQGVEEGGGREGRREGGRKEKKKIWKQGGREYYTSTKIMTVADL